MEDSQKSLSPKSPHSLLFFLLSSLSSTFVGDASCLNLRASGASSDSVSLICMAWPRSSLALGSTGFSSGGVKNPALLEDPPVLGVFMAEGFVGFSISLGVFIIISGM